MGFSGVKKITNSRKRPLNAQERVFKQTGTLSGEQRPGNFKPGCNESRLVWRYHRFILGMNGYADDMKLRHYILGTNSERRCFKFFL